MASTAEPVGHAGPEDLYHPGTRRLDARLVLDRSGTAVYAYGALTLPYAVGTGGPGLTELFAGAGVDTSRDAAYEVVCARSDVRLTVPGDRSILAVLAGAVVEWMSQSEEGGCGSCEAAVLEGVPAHRDDLLNDKERDENAVMVVYVSWARGCRLVLDI